MSAKYNVQLALYYTGLCTYYFNWTDIPTEVLIIFSYFCAFLFNWSIFLNDPANVLPSAYKYGSFHILFDIWHFNLYKFVNFIPHLIYFIVKLKSYPRPKKTSKWNSTVRDYSPLLSRQSRAWKFTTRPIRIPYTLVIRSGHPRILSSFLAKMTKKPHHKYPRRAACIYALSTIRRERKKSRPSSRTYVHSRIYMRGNSSALRTPRSEFQRRKLLAAGGGKERNRETTS